MGVRGLWRVVVTVTMVSAVLVPPARAAQFEEILPGTIPDSLGIAWGDYDGDGYPDLFVAGYNHPDQLAHGPLIFRNNHDLTFTDMSASLGLPSAPVDNEGAAWADYDNDGRLDVLSSCDSGTPFLFHQEASQFALVMPPSGLVGAGPTTGAAWCDYDGDSLLDVFVPTPGEGYLFHNNGDGTFADVHVAAGVVTSAPGSTTAAAWGDFDNDGWPDLIITRASGPVLLFHNNEDGTFTDVSAKSGLDVAFDMYSVAWADYDNDGRLDCYAGAAVYATPHSQSLLFHNNGDGTFTDVTNAASMGGDSAAGASLAWGDYDNDGYLDLYVGTWNWTGDAPPPLYHNNGDGTFTNVVVGSGLEGHYSHTGAAWADLDLDGRLDLAQGNGNHPARLFHNIGAAGNWLRVQALTSKSGDATGSDPVRDAVGAVVKLNLDDDPTVPTGGARTLVRFIDGGSGHWAQNEQIAQFGLGSATLVAVRVRFPDGSVVIHRDVAANQQITIRDVPADYVEIFTDVPLDYWSYPQVKAVEDANIVKGYTDGTYKPTDPVTRDQMAVYMSRALAGGDTSVPAFTGTPSFSDVDTSNWALKYVQYAVSKGVVKGYSDGTYKPTDQVDRGQMSVFVARAIATPTAGADLVNYTPPATATFPDVATSFWAYKYVEYIAQPTVAVTQGYPDGDYHPEYVCTRDQMAVYVARAFKLPV